MNISGRDLTFLRIMALMVFAAGLGLIWFWPLTLIGLLLWLGAYKMAMIDWGEVFAYIQKLA